MSNRNYELRRLFRAELGGKKCEGTKHAIFLAKNMISSAKNMKISPKEKIKNDTHSGKAGRAAQKA